MEQEKKDPDTTQFLSGALNILGLKIDLGELLASPENLKERLEELREKLKAAGGREALSDEEWQQGGMTVTGHIRTRGILGDQEYHIGTTQKARPGRKPAPELPEEMEPPVDVFDEAEEITILADVPGVSMNDLDLKVEGRRLLLSTRPTAPRRYRKELNLDAEVEPGSLESTCNNGVLEIRLHKRQGETDSR